MKNKLTMNNRINSRDQSKKSDNNRIGNTQDQGTHRHQRRRLTTHTREAITMEDNSSSSTRRLDIMENEEQEQEEKEDKVEMEEGVNGYQEEEEEEEEKIMFIHRTASIVN